MDTKELFIILICALDPKHDTLTNEINDNGVIIHNIGNFYCEGLMNPQALGVFLEKLMNDEFDVKSQAQFEKIKWLEKFELRLHLRLDNDNYVIDDTAYGIKTLN